jgi:hypothetical protein
MELCFRDTNRGYRYFIDLTRMRTSAAALDWIIQLRKKSWATSRDIGDLVAAVRDLLDPQANMCRCAMQGGDDLGTAIDAAALVRTRYGVGRRT